MITMRIKKLFAVAAAALVTLAPSFTGAASANAAAALTTWVSVLHPNHYPSNMVLDVVGGSTANGARIQLWERNGNSQQYWTMVKNDRVAYQGRLVYRLVNQKSGKCLDMKSDGSVGNGTPVQQWDCNGRSNQSWVAWPVTDSSTKNWVMLRSLERPDLCLDAYDFRYSSGTPIQVWECFGAWNQRFNIY
jgi:hypothetical protein